MRRLAPGIALALILALFPLASQAGPAGSPPHPQVEDAHIPPPPAAAALSSIGSAPRGPSQFMAGVVAVRLVLPESDGSLEPSTEDWAPAQVEAVREQVQAALDWWAARLPLARLRFQLSVEVAPTGYEPIRHGLADEGRWIGDLLARRGFQGPSYFDQAYAAADALRAETGADWATTLFVVNSASQRNGFFPDGRFAYAYIHGPFLVLTSEAGVYGTDRLAAVAAHELGHTFGALDQYAAARVACDRRSGYLDAPTSNSLYGGCGAGAPSVMLEPIGAFATGSVDASALHQLGYRDSDGDGLIDPLDTLPALALSESALATGGGRPTLEGRVIDQPLPSTYHVDVTLNHIAAVEYRVDGGPWLPAAAGDGAFDSADEQFTAELPLYDGSYALELRAANSAGGASTPLARLITVAGVGPQPAYAVSAPALVNSTDVTLALRAPAGAAVQVSAEISFRNAPWQPYGPELRHTFAADGAHQLFVRFRDAAGLLSLPFAAGVTVDTIPPQGSAVRDPGDGARLVLRAGDAGSGVEAVALHIGGAAPRWMPYAPSVELTDAPAEQAVRVQFRDAAGNLSPLYTATSGHAVALPFLAR